MDEENDEMSKSKDADSAAKHLANLMGTAVAGQTPDSASIDLEIELFDRNNLSIASLVILSVLIKGTDSNRELVTTDVRKEFFKIKSFERYLFEISTEAISTHDVVSESAIEAQILEYSPRMYGEQANESFLRELRFKWYQIIQLEPTRNQIIRAIELRRSWAQ